SRRGASAATGETTGGTTGGRGITAGRGRTTAGDRGASASTTTAGNPGACRPTLAPSRRWASAGRRRERGQDLEVSLSSNERRNRAYTLQGSHVRPRQDRSQRLCKEQGVLPRGTRTARHSHCRGGAA